MLNANKMMGTMIGRRQQMQDIKDGKATCILKGKFTPVRPGTSHIAFHHHAGAGVRRVTDWPAQQEENLVAHLRRLDGSCIVGPFMDADDLLRESKDGRRYKLGTGMTREVVQAMLALKGGRLWVYMFYPAEACPALVWNEDEGAASRLEGWDYFVYNMRGERLSDDVWFYLRRQAGSAGSRLPLTMTTGPTTAATTMNYATALVMGVGGAGAVDFGAVGYRAVVLEDMLPTNEWGSMDDQQDAVNASDGGGGMMMGAGGGGGVARAEARPVQVSLSMLEMLEATRMRTVVEQPVFVSEAVQDMLRLTRERCEQLLQVEAIRAGGGVHAGVLGALRMMRGALVGMEVAVSMGGMAIGGSLGDIMNALQQYQWAMEDAGNPAADIERVRVVWLALSSLHARVLTLARYGYAANNNGGAGPIPFD